MNRALCLVLHGLDEAVKRAEKLLLVPQGKPLEEIGHGVEPRSQCPLGFLDACWRQLDERGPAVRRVRTPRYQVRLFESVNHRRHVPRGYAELVAECPHDGGTTAVQRLEQPHALVGKAVAGVRIRPPQEGGGETCSLCHERPAPPCLVHPRQPARARIVFHHVSVPELSHYGDYYI